MNEKTESARPTGLEEAPAALRSPGAIEQPERPSWRPEKPEDLPGQDLRNADLTGCPWLLPEHLAGSDLTCNRTLPDEIAKFPALDQVAAISAEARKIFIGLLAACVYSWLVIGTTMDVALILNTASSPLPIINTPIPIAGFYVVGATLLAAVYCYLHFYLQRLWRTLATLPAVFPDGVALDDKTDPWLLNNLVRTDFERLRGKAPPLARLENLLAVLLAWALVPATLLALWTRYLPAHGRLGTTWLVLLIGLATLFGRHTYRLARAALQGQALPSAGLGDRNQGILARAWHEFSQLHPDRLTIGLIAALIVCSLSAFRDNPRNPYTWVAKGLNAFGIRTFADLREVEVAQRPEGWEVKDWSQIGKDWSKIKRVDFRGRNLAFADLSRVFLANADLRDANLTGAILLNAELHGADFYDNDAGTGAQLQGADLRSARLHGAELAEAQLQGANLEGAWLGGADLSGAHLQGANLFSAWLQGATLSGAKLQGAVLVGAWIEGASLNGAQLEGAVLQEARLQGAYLEGAELQGAYLSGAQLQGAYLKGARLEGAELRDAQLQGADLRGAGLWRTLADGAAWDLADLRSSTVQAMTKTDVNALIARVAADITDESPRKNAVEFLTQALNTDDRPAGPDFPVVWQSHPTVMFNIDDPKPEPFPWGPPKWTSERAYDEDLAKALGDLACGRDVFEAQTRGIARRALIFEDQNRLFAVRLAARLMGPDCPSANRLLDYERRDLEQLAARGDGAGAVPETSPPDPVD